MKRVFKMEQSKQCYKKNFLTNVIVRIDFINPIDEIQEKIPNELSKNLMKLFPIIEPNTITHGSFKIDVNNLEPRGIEKRNVNQWKLFNQDRTRILEFDMYHFAMIFNKYESFDSFSDLFLKSVNYLLSQFTQIQVRRLGLRYINEINIPGKTFNWRGFISSKLTSLLDSVEDKSIISRALSSIDLKFEEYRVKFQFGMHNPDFPSTIKKKHFILDYDAVSESLLNLEDIKDLLPKLHAQINKLFEQSIGNKLKELLNGKE